MSRRLACAKLACDLAPRGPMGLVAAGNVVARRFGGVHLGTRRYESSSSVQVEVEAPSGSLSTDGSPRPPQQPGPDHSHQKAFRRLLVQSSLPTPALQSVDVPSEVSAEWAEYRRAVKQLEHRVLGAKQYNIAEGRKGFKALKRQFVEHLKAQHGDQWQLMLDWCMASTSTSLVQQCRRLLDTSGVLAQHCRKSFKRISYRHVKQESTFGDQGVDTLRVIPRLSRLTGTTLSDTEIVAHRVRTFLLQSHIREPSRSLGRTAQLFDTLVPAGLARGQRLWEKVTSVLLQHEYWALQVNLNALLTEAGTLLLQRQIREPVKSPGKEDQLLSIIASPSLLDARRVRPQGLLKLLKRTRKALDRPLQPESP